jgi:hypothetical protein
MALMVLSCAHGCGRIFYVVAGAEQSIYCGGCSEWTVLTIRKDDSEQQSEED